MSCSHCDHCKAIASRQSLRLPHPPGNYGRNGPDMAFYMAFGRAYDRARALGPQPMNRLRDVNPWLTPSQCKSYLKRARALGQVQAPGRVAPASTTVVGTDEPGRHPLAGTSLAPAWDAGLPISRSGVLTLVCGHDGAKADKVLDQLVEQYGATRIRDGVQPPS